MKELRYSKYNYRRNLELYWQQFYPNWKIPKGYHVHHIKPRSLMRDDNDVHHPTNLIALHVDDHVTIHKCRGDKPIGNFICVAGVRKGQPVSAETRLKMSMAKKGRVMSKEQKEHLSVSIKTAGISSIMFCAISGIGPSSIA